MTLRSALFSFGLVSLLSAAACSAPAEADGDEEASIGLDAEPKYVETAEVTGSGSASYGASYTLSTTRNFVSAWIWLNRGETLNVGTCGVSGSSGTGDTFLRLYGKGAEVAYNDDACGGDGRSSRITYSAWTTTNYELRMGCYADASCGGTVTWTISPAPEYGRISMWQGKVNLHKPTGGSWTWDADCRSGANVDPLTYCQKFWPATTTATLVESTSKSVWKTAGCGGNYTSYGQLEYSCKP